MDLNPDWEFRVWTDKENRELVKEHYPHLLALYDTYTSRELIWSITLVPASGLLRGTRRRKGKSEAMKKADV